MDEKKLESKTKRRMKELYYGDRTYLPGHKKPAVVKPVPAVKPTPNTRRTTQIEGGLKQAGLTEKEIARFRGKK